MFQFNFSLLASRLADDFVWNIVELHIEIVFGMVVLATVVAVLMLLKLLGFVRGCYYFGINKRTNTI